MLAEVVGTNKAGINDLKSGKKKISVDVICGMKKAYPDISLDWFVLGEGTMFLKDIEVSKGNDIVLLLEYAEKKDKRIEELSSENALLRKEISDSKSKKTIDKDYLYDARKKLTK